MKTMEDRRGEEARLLEEGVPSATPSKVAPRDRWTGGSLHIQPELIAVSVGEMTDECVR